MKMNIAKKVKDFDNLTVTFAFTNGRRIMADVKAMSREMLEHLAVHGVSQKAGDSYAGAADKGWSVDEAADACQQVIDNLMNGVWNAAGSGSGVTILAEALARLTGKTTDEAIAVIAAMSEEAVKQLERRADMKAAVAAIKAERAAERAKAIDDGDAGDLADLF